MAFVITGKDYRRLNADASQTRAMFQAVAADANRVPAGQQRPEWKLPQRDHQEAILLSANPGNSSNSVQGKQQWAGQPLTEDNNKYLNI